MLKMILCVAGGGAAGAVLRYWLQGVVQNLTAGVLPWGTLVVNLSGCLVIGILGGLFDAVVVSPYIRTLLLVGVLGGYTTFSSFGLETARLLADREWMWALVNVAVSCVLGLVLVFAGMFLSRLFLSLFK